MLDVPKLVNKNVKKIQAPELGSETIPLVQAALISTSELKRKLYESDLSFKRMRQTEIGYIIFAALFLGLQNYYHTQNITRAWGHSHNEQVVHISVIAGMVFSCIISIYLYIICATGTLGDWLNIGVIDSQIEREDKIIAGLHQVSSQNCERRRSRLEVELGFYDSRNDTLKLVVATASGILIGSLAIAKDGNFYLSTWATFFISCLFFANAQFVLNRQTLRRLCWILLKAEEAAKESEAQAEVNRHDGDT